MAVVDRLYLIRCQDVLHETLSNLSVRRVIAAAKIPENVPLLNNYFRNTLIRFGLSLNYNQNKCILHIASNLPGYISSSCDDCLLWKDDYLDLGVVYAHCKYQSKHAENLFFMDTSNMRDLDQVNWCRFTQLRYILVSRVADTPVEIRHQIVGICTYDPTNFRYDNYPNLRTMYIEACEMLESILSTIELTHLSVTLAIPANIKLPASLTSLCSNNVGLIGLDDCKQLEDAHILIRGNDPYWMKLTCLPKLRKLVLKSNNTDDIKISHLIVSYLSHYDNCEMRDSAGVIHDKICNCPLVFKSRYLKSVIIEGVKHKMEFNSPGLSRFILRNATDVAVRASRANCSIMNANSVYIEAPHAKHHNIIKVNTAVFENANNLQKLLLRQVNNVEGQFPCLTHVYYSANIHLARMPRLQCMKAYHVKYDGEIDLTRYPLLEYVKLENCKFHYVVTQSNNKITQQGSEIKEISKIPVLVLK